MKVNIPKNKMTELTTTPIEIYMQLEQKKENLKFHNLEEKKFKPKLRLKLLLYSTKRGKKERKEKGKSPLLPPKG